MKIIGEKFANLINVKTIVTFIVTIVFAILSLQGVIEPDTVMTVVVMVIGFYFGTQHEQNVQKGEKYEQQFISETHENKPE